MLSVTVVSAAAGLQRDLTKGSDLNQDMDSNFVVDGHETAGASCRR